MKTVVLFLLALPALALSQVVGFNPGRSYCDNLKNDFSFYYEIINTEASRAEDDRYQGKDEEEIRLLAKLRAYVKANPRQSFEVFYMQNVDPRDAERCLTEVADSQRNNNIEPTPTSSSSEQTNPRRGSIDTAFPRGNTFGTRRTIRRFRNPQQGLFPGRGNLRNSVANPNSLANPLFYGGSIRQE